MEILEALGVGARKERGRFKERKSARKIWTLKKRHTFCCHITSPFRENKNDFRAKSKGGGSQKKRGHSYLPAYILLMKKGGRGIS